MGRRLNKKVKWATKNGSNQCQTARRKGMSSAQNLTKKITTTMMMDDNDETQMTAVRRLVEVDRDYLGELVYD